VGEEMTTTTDHNAAEQKYRQAIYINGVFLRWHYWGFIKEHGNITFVAPETTLSTIEEAYKNSCRCVGVEDMDGQEIYQGDILKDKYGRILLVEWYKHGFSFKALTETNFLRARDINQWFEDVETIPKIIANICEDYELDEGVNVNV
jgi:hypothetical protein